MSIQAATTAASAPIAPGADACVTMSGLDWRGYLTLLRLRGERNVPRIVYLDGTAWLMSPAYPHEHLKKRLGTFVTEVTVGLDIPCIPAGSTTFRRRKKRGGVEGDETFYLANAGRVRGKIGMNIRLRTDPPPDLAIEVVHTHAADAAIEVYRRIGVPEIWVWDNDALRILSRQANGRYHEVATSLAFPFLNAATITEWIGKPREDSETDWIKAVRCWVRDTLAPDTRKPEREV